MARKKIPAYVIKLIDSLSDTFDVGTYDLRATLLHEESPTGAACEVNVEQDYHRISINIFPVFFTKHRKDQREFLLHEFCHTVIWDLFKLLTDLKDGKHVTEHQIKEHNERATSRMTHFLNGMMQGHYKRARAAYKEFLKLPTRKRAKVLKKKKK